MSDKCNQGGHTEGAPRDCGACNVCCTAMRVKPLDKAAGDPCQHQTDDGCGNYADRPDVCRSWYCLWVRDDRGVFTEEHRPDQLGLFFTASRTDDQTGRQTIYAHEISPGSADWPQAVNAVRYLRQFVPVTTLRFKGELTDLTVHGKSAA